ncbi:hypothetical protein DFH28DRAFT_981364 [Melampsora americana]|nr:hypothetical protein DFH28DRAFT_981364 [Melampsora americana]
MINPILDQPNPSTWIPSKTYDLTNTSSALHQLNSTDYSSTIPNSRLLKMEPDRPHILAVPLLVVYLLSYILQLGFLGRGVSICYRCNVAWFFKKNQRSLILPNTRFLIALCNILFVSVQFIDTIFLVISALGPALYTERYRISSFVWFTLWLSGWMLLWGIAACYVVMSYTKDGFIAKLSSTPVMSKLFNTFFISVAILVTMTHIVTFALTVENQLSLSSVIQSTLSQLPDSAGSIADPTLKLHQFMELSSIRTRFGELVRWIFYMRLTWSSFLLVLLIPFGISLTRMLQKVKSTGDRDRSGSGCQFIDFSSHIRKNSKTSEKTRLEQSSNDSSTFSISSKKSAYLGSQKSGTITNVVLVFLHTLIYSLIVIGFAPSLHSSTTKLQDKAETLRQLAYISKGLYAIVGLWSSWLFLRLTRETRSGETSERKPKGITSTPRGSLPDQGLHKPCTPTKRAPLSNDCLDQLSAFKFPDKPALASSR